MPDAESLRTMLKSQYHASLAMLRDAIARCPDDEWAATAHTNPCWRVAYHTLFYAHFYLGQDEASFTPWEGHQRHVQRLDGSLPPGSDPSEPPPPVPRPYTRDETLAYWSHCDEMVDAAIDHLDLDRADSGFPWYRMSKFEHQLVSLRHIQHHTAQLVDRLRRSHGLATRWVGAVPSSRA
jgi:hypothetical protein